ncbi:MAG: hypothetical protein Q9160_007312 [Pyrenula sp. 1 TL-2023]
MPSREEVAYFGAGPAPLPTHVIEAGAQAFVNYNDTGLGLAEISHRSPTANAILAEAKSAMTELLDIPENYEILFMQAGGSGEFSAVVQNLVPVWIERRRARIEQELKDEGKTEDVREEATVQRLRNAVEEELKVDYLVTGSWSLKASQEAARLLGEKYVNVALDARKSNGGKFGKIPEDEPWTLTKTKKEGGKAAPAFVYYCDNETVDGVEFRDFPKQLEPSSSEDDDDARLVVADMSSNFLSRKIDIKKYAVIFGGAQKNVGVTGITIVIVRKSLLPPQTPTPKPSLLHSLPIGGLPAPVVLDYATIAKNNSLYNTLPIFNLWIAAQVMVDLVKTYRAEKVGGQERVANEKAESLYGVLDKYPEVFQVVPDQSARSRMNVCFRVKGGDAAAEKKFLEGAEKKMLQGLKGHRSVGGIRASNYNAVPVGNVQKLMGYLEEFASEGNA